LRSDLPTAKLIIAGEGSLDAEVRGCLRSSADVEFFGRYEPAELDDLLRRMSVVALPSRGEPFGMTVLEAMAAGRPVIVTDTGTPPTLIGGAGGSGGSGGAGGSVVPAGDVEALREAMVRYGTLDPARLAQAGSDARVRAEAFSCEAAISGLESAYASVIAAHHRSPHP